MYSFDTEAQENEASDKEGDDVKEDNSEDVKDGSSAEEQQRSVAAEPDIVFTDLLEEADTSSEKDLYDEHLDTMRKHEAEIAASSTETCADTDEAVDEDLTDNNFDEQSSQQAEAKADIPDIESSEIPEEIEENEEKEKKSLKQQWDDIKPFIPVGKKGFKKLLKLIRIRNLEIHLTVGGKDPYAAGMNFAKTNMAFYPALAHLCSAFSVTVKRTEISCNFNEKELDCSGSLKVLIRPSAVICLAAYLGINYFIITRKQKKKQNNNSDKDIKEGN